MNQPAARRVLILESDDLHGPLVERLFVELGWRPVLTDRPSLALNALHDGLVPDLFLIAGRPAHDVSMVARLLVGRLPVLYMSASVFRSRPPQLAEPGVLAKPFSLEQLALMVNRTLELAGPVPAS